MQDVIHNTVPGVLLLFCMFVDKKKSNLLVLSDQQQPSLMLTISGDQVRNHQFVTWTGYKPAFR